ncbi:flagellar basal body rod protein FlgB [Candidatus Sumerlaeota bacterium]|nr:flagellar basal body rod protein FlgB [Candidatus Sumerlaeota bacterium]
MIHDLFGGSLSHMQAALDVRSLRQEVLASNLANSDTPGFRAVDVDFEATMREMVERMDRADAASAASTTPSRSLMDALTLRADDSTSIGNSQNSVDVDQQLSHLEENALMFQVTAQIMARRFQSLRNVIEEGGRGG